MNLLSLIICLLTKQRLQKHIRFSVTRLENTNLSILNTVSGRKQEEVSENIHASYAVQNRSSSLSSAKTPGPMQEKIWSCINKYLYNIPSVMH